MALSLTSLHDNMVRQFSTSVSDPRFQKDFIDAVNISLDQLSDAARLTTPMAHISNYKATISELDSTDLNILEPVLVFNLISAGRKHVRGDEAYTKQKENYDEALGDFMVNKNLEDQASVAVDGTGASVAGLGDVTDSDY